MEEASEVTVCRRRRASWISGSRRETRCSAAQHRPSGGRRGPLANAVDDVREFRTRCDECGFPLPESRFRVRQCSGNSFIHGTTEVGEPMRSEEVAEDVTQHLSLNDLTSHKSVIRADRCPAFPA
jgi:hypothetical protein